MKKFLLFSMLSVGALTTAVSCADDDNNPVDNVDTYSVVYDITGNFTKNSKGIYTIYKQFNNTIPSTDVIMVYRLKETVNGTAVWQQIPRTLFLDQGELDYDFDFTRNDVEIKVGGNYDIATTPTYLNNQTFRVVFVPAEAGRNAAVVKGYYKNVVDFYKIDDRNVPKL